MIVQNHTTNRVNNTRIEGNHNKNYGDNNTIVGHHNTNYGNNLIVEGNHNKNYGDNITTKGNHNVTEGENGNSIGSYNSTGRKKVRTTKSSSSDESSDDDNVDNLTTSDGIMIQSVGGKVIQKIGVGRNVAQNVRVGGSVVQTVKVGGRTITNHFNNATVGGVIYGTGNLFHNSTIKDGNFSNITVCNGNVTSTYIESNDYCEVNTRNGIPGRDGFYHRNGIVRCELNGKQYVIKDGELSCDGEIKRKDLPVYINTVKYTFKNHKLLLNNLVDVILE